MADRLMQLSTSAGYENNISRLLFLPPLPLLLLYLSMDTSGQMSSSSSNYLAVSLLP